jgi:hypothetical protein
MKIKFYKNQLIALLILMGMTVSTGIAQEVITLTPSKDNTLYENIEVELSNGSGVYFFAGRTAGRSGEALRRAVFAFPVADSLPAGATIDSVVLQLRVSKTNQAGTLNFTLHHMDADWGEGASDAPSNEGGGTVPDTNDATWNFSFFNTTQWAQPGGDYDTNAVATQSVAGEGFYTWGSTADMVADVQSWLDNPQDNFGWMLRGNEGVAASAKRFDSRESLTAENRPQLTIYYTPLLDAISTSNEIQPATFALEQNFPNPFNPTTRIRFDIAKAGPAQLVVYNLLGQEVQTLIDGVLTPNQYTVNWNGLNSAGKPAPSGFYFYILKTADYSASRKMILIR